MRHELNFWVLGGDMRQGKLAQLLAEDGHRVHTLWRMGPSQLPDSQRNPAFPGWSRRTAWSSPSLFHRAGDF